MVDLDDVLHRTLDQGDRALADLSLDDDTTTVLRGRISARRARRHVLQAVVGAPIAAGLVIGGVLLTQGLGTPAPGVTQPAGSPTEQPSQQPTPTGESSPEATPDPASQLPDEPGLPTRYALPEGLLAQTTPGWVLATYLPQTAEQPPSQAVVVLASPAGAVYEVTRVPVEPAPDGTKMSIVDWRAGTTTAVIERRDSSADGDVVGLFDLDLLTSETRPTDVPVPGAELVSASDDLTVWWDTQASELVMDTASGRSRFGPFGLGIVDPSPDGRHVLADTTVVDTRTGDPVAEIQGLRADGWCLPLTWWTADQVLVSCTDSDPSEWEEPYLDLNPRLVVLAADADPTERGTLVRTLEVGDPVLYAWYPTWVADGEVVLQGTTLDAKTSLLGDLCPDGAYLIGADGGVTALPTSERRDGATVFVSRVAEGRVLTQSTGGCVYDAPPGLLRSFDPATGATGVVLGPLAGDEAWLETRYTWLVGR